MNIRLKQATLSLKAGTVVSTQGKCVAVNEEATMVAIWDKGMCLQVPCEVTTDPVTVTNEDEEKTEPTTTPDSAGVSDSGVETGITEPPKPDLGFDDSVVQ